MENKLLKASGAARLVNLSFIAQVYAFLMQLLLVRLLLPGEYGLFAVAAVVADYFLLLVGHGLRESIIIIRGEKRIIDTAMILSFIGAALLCILGFSVQKILDVLPNLELGDVRIIALLCWARAPGIIGQVYIAVFDRWLKYEMASYIRFLSLVVPPTIAVIAGYYSFGIYSLVLREAIYSLILLFGGLWLVNFRLPRHFSPSTAIKIVKVSIQKIALRFTELTYFKLPILFIASFFGPVSAGYLDRAFFLASLPGSILPTIQSLLLASTSKNQRQPEILSQLFSEISSLSFLLLVPLMLFFSAFPVEIVRIFFGENWIPSSDFLRYTAFYVLFGTLVFNCENLLVGLRKINQASLAYILGILTALLSFLLSMASSDPTFTGLYYSIASLIAMIVMIYVLRISGIFRFEIIKRIILYFSIAVILMFLNKLIPIYSHEIINLLKLILVTLSIILLVYLERSGVLTIMRLINIKKS